MTDWGAIVGIINLTDIIEDTFVFHDARTFQNPVLHPELPCAFRVLLEKVSER